MSERTIGTNWASIVLFPSTSSELQMRVHPEIRIPNIHAQARTPQKPAATQK